PDGAQDVEPGSDRAMLVRQPADKAEGLAWHERHRAAPAIEDVLVDEVAEAQPVLLAIAVEQQLDCGDRRRHGVLAASVGVSGKRSSSSARSSSATVSPCAKAASLMRARRAGVTSIVRRAVYSSRFPNIAGARSATQRSAPAGVGLAPIRGGPARGA